MSALGLDSGETWEEAKMPKGGGLLKGVRAAEQLEVAAAAEAVEVVPAAVEVVVAVGAANRSRRGYGSESKPTLLFL